MVKVRLVQVEFATEKTFVRALYSIDRYLHVAVTTEIAVVLPLLVVDTLFEVIIVLILVVTSSDEESFRRVIRQYVTIEIMTHAKSRTVKMAIRIIFHDDLGL